MKRMQLLQEMDLGGVLAGGRAVGRCRRIGSKPSALTLKRAAWFQHFCLDAPSHSL